MGETARAHPDGVALIIVRKTKDVNRKIQEKHPEEREDGAE